MTELMTGKYMRMYREKFIKSASRRLRVYHFEQRLLRLFDQG